MAISSLFENSSGHIFFISELQVNPGGTEPRALECPAGVRVMGDSISAPPIPVLSTLLRLRALLHRLISPQKNGLQSR
jgi:hypothetical protein